MVMSNDIPDWLKALAATELSPAQIAAGDQHITAGRRAAADLLVNYLGYCRAMDANDQDKVIWHHLQFQTVFAQLEKHIAMYTVIFLCDLLTQELMAKHGDINGMVTASLDGTLLAGNDPSSDWEHELLKHLEEQQ